jgi:hypothetical protein
LSNIIEIVFKKGVLVDLSISRWSALHQMKTDDILLKQLNRKVIYPGHKKLLPEDENYPLQHQEGQIRSFVGSKSMPAPIAGVVFVNYKVLGELLKGLKKMRTEYLKLAQGLYDRYEDVKTKQISVLNEESYKIAIQNGLHNQTLGAAEALTLVAWLDSQRKQHTNLYPAKEDLLAKFDVTWRLFKVNPLGEADATLLDDEEAAIVIEQQKKLQKDMEDWVKQQAIAMHKKLGQAAAQAQKLLADNGKLNPKNLKPLLKAFDEFQAVDFAGSTFQKYIKDAKAQFFKKDVSMQDVAEAVNDSQEEFGKLLDSMADLAVDEVAKKAGAVVLSSSEFKRIVEV